MDEPNAASVALIDGDKVLVIQRAFAPFAGLWTLPGGRREPGETIANTAAREVREELGLGVADLRAVRAMRLGGGFLLQVFATTTFAGEIVASPEVAGLRWIDPDELASLPTTPELDVVVAEAFALFRG